MRVGVLIGQSTEWTSLHHGYQPGPEFKVLVPDIDGRPGGHVGDSGNGLLAEGLLGHFVSSRWCSGDCFA